MSNIITIQATIFENNHSGEKTFGVRVYDNYDSVYDNTWESIPDNDLDIFLKCLNESDNHIIVSMLEFVEERETGVSINDKWYEWEEIQHCFVEDVA